MSLYVVSDVHSYCTKLKRTLDNMGFFLSEENKLVLCGDAFDRGEEALEMMDFLVELLENGQLIYIRGNHEDIMGQMLEDIQNGISLYTIALGMNRYYSENGTWDTALQLTGMSGSEVIEQRDLFLNKIRQTPFYTKLLPATVDYYEIDDYIFTHGFIPVTVSGGYGANVKYTYDPDWRNAPKEKWDKARWLNGMQVACKHHVKEEGKTIVVGHYNTSWGHHSISRICPEWGREANFLPFRNEENGIIAIDACTAYSGRINCIII